MKKKVHKMKNFTIFAKIEYRLEIEIEAENEKEALSIFEKMSTKGDVQLIFSHPESDGWQIESIEES